MYKSRTLNANHILVHFAVIILYYAFLNLEMFCEVYFRATAGVVTCSKAAGGGVSFFSSFLDNRVLNILGTGDTRAFTGEK